MLDKLQRFTNLNITFNGTQSSVPDLWGWQSPGYIYNYVTYDSDGKAYHGCLYFGTTLEQD